MDTPEETTPENSVPESTDSAEAQAPENTPLDLSEEQIKKAREKLSIPDKRTSLPDKQTHLPDEEAFYANRQSFLRFNRFKIHQNLITLSEIDQTIFLIIPRLLHVHQEGLPGYFEGNPPCGIHNFKLDQEAQYAMEKMFPDVIHA